MIPSPRRTLTCLLSFVFLIAFFRARAQDTAEERERLRRENLEAIERIQDLRSPHDGKLLSLLGDDDEAVRERATLAYGSIQDTTVLPLLTRNLTSGSASLQLAAAFAIGQTGTLLGMPGRQQLEYDLIWKRLDQTSVDDRLIEEIGKFGTEEGLKDLMVRVGNAPPLRLTHGLTMCIARYAIRGIVSDEAVRYLLQFVSPADRTPWEVAYALQRIGPHPFVRQAIEEIVLLAKHQDPLVRMNVATLLGRIRDERTSLDPLAKLAEFDGDWRVRVNALRALSVFPIKGHPVIMDLFRRAFFSDNDNVALTALSSFGQTGISPQDTSDEAREALRQLRYVAENRDNNFPWQHQGAAAIAYAQVVGPPALQSVTPTAWPEPRLQAELLEAVAATGDPAAADVLAASTASDQSIIACAALNGLSALVHRHPADPSLVQRVLDRAQHALAGDDVAVVTTAASILGDSLFLRPTSVEPLLRCLGGLSIPHDIEAMQEISATLGKLGDRRAVPALINELRAPNRAVAVSAADALGLVTGVEYRSSLLPWYQPTFTDFDFSYLRTVPPVISVRLETSRGDVVIRLRKDVAPFTIMSILKLAGQRGFYRGLVFHRVVPNFVVQGGDPRGDGWGGPEYTLRSEFSPLSFDAGTVGMASAGKDTEGSQFFITQSPQPHLDGRYTIVGHVESGMDVVDRLQVGDRIYDLRILTESAVPR